MEKFYEILKSDGKIIYYRVIKNAIVKVQFFESVDWVDYPFCANTQDGKKIWGMIVFPNSECSSYMRVKSDISDQNF